jgi:hypothetical protein
MAALRKQSVLERRLRDIEREKKRLRKQMAEVRQWADDEARPAALQTAPGGRAGAGPSTGRDRVLAGEDAGARRGVAQVIEREAELAPEEETTLDFAPGPEGLDTKRVVMPRLQRTDLLRPAIGGTGSASKLVEPEYDRFRNYFGSAGLKRVREARRERGNQRVRAIFMMVMVLTLGFILFKMLI